MLNIPPTKEKEGIQGSLPRGTFFKALCTALALELLLAAGFPLACCAVLCRAQSHFPRFSCVHLPHTQMASSLSSPSALCYPDGCRTGLAFPVYSLGAKKDLSNGSVLSVVSKDS